MNAATRAKEIDEELQSRGYTVYMTYDTANSQYILYYYSTVWQSHFVAYISFLKARDSMHCRKATGYHTGKFLYYFVFPSKNDYVALRILPVKHQVYASKPAETGKGTAWGYVKIPYNQAKLESGSAIWDFAINLVEKANENALQIDD